MPDADRAVLLQAVIDEICAEIAEAATRERIAAKLREALRADHCSVEDLKRAGRDELMRAPTMWR